MTIGIDEVGRGSWAGPLVVGAVSLKNNIDGLADSKILSKGKREELAEIIKKEAKFIGLGWVYPGEIDDLGLAEAMVTACKRAIKDAPKDALIKIDGKVNFLKDNPLVETIIGGDMLVKEISAASIVAKVARDKYMTELDKKLPGYGFDKNVGYGTLSHRQGIAKHGLTPAHRWSYKPIVQILNNYEA